MRRFTELCESISRTTKKTEKIALVADFFQSNSAADSARASIFLSGRAFPAHEETTLNVGGALLARVLLDVTVASNHQLGMAYRRHGDLGSAAFDLFAEAHLTPQMPMITLEELEAKFRTIAAASGPAAKAAIVRDLFQRASPLEAKYLIKFMGGDLRIGLRESLVEEAIAKAYGAPHTDVRRANMLLGDISAALRLAAEHRLSDAQMRLFHPIGMMLATPVESASEAVTFFSNTEIHIEDKYDGIRAQVHTDGERVRIFSRTMDDVTESFPELAESLHAIRETVILDGEILAWESNADGRALPFTRLQQRLGRKWPSIELMRESPVAFIAFDVLYAEGDLVIERPLRERGKILDEIFARIEPATEVFALPPRTSSRVSQSKRKPAHANVVQRHLFEPSEDHIIAVKEQADSVPLPPIIRAPIFRAESPEELEMLFDAAQARGNEGLMIKDVDSPYTPGRRGKSWLKLKRELATLDVVVTAVEYGHGKRAGVLSDYTFAVRDPDSGRLLNVGKAYSGLTDTEIAELTDWFNAHKIEDFGHSLLIEPKIILEVAFNNVMISDRHASGYALRFPRILRVRTDKPVSEIDTLERVREIFQTQHGRR